MPSIILPVTNRIHTDRLISEMLSMLTVHILLFNFIKLFTYHMKICVIYCSFVAHISFSTSKVSIKKVHCVGPNILIMHLSPSWRAKGPRRCIRDLCPFWHAKFCGVPRSSWHTRRSGLRNTPGYRCLFERERERESERVSERGRGRESARKRERERERERVDPVSMTLNNQQESTCASAPRGLRTASTTTEASLVKQACVCVCVRTCVYI